MKRASASPTRSRAVSNASGVVGAGLMATQLAALFLRRLEVPLVITDVDPERVTEALAAIRADLAKQVARGAPQREQGGFPRVDRDGRRGHCCLRRVRPRDRGGVRGDRREAAGARRARAGRLRRVPPGHEHVVAVGVGDGRGAAAARAPRRDALLQPGCGAAARRARADAPRPMRSRSQRPGT